MHTQPRGSAPRRAGDGWQRLCRARLRPATRSGRSPSSADRLEVWARGKSYVNFCIGEMAVPWGSFSVFLGARIEVQVEEAALAVGFLSDCQVGEL